MIVALKRWYAGLRDENTKLHILTDYPQKAAYIKKQLPEGKRR